MLDFIIIGAAQAGLAMAYELKQQGFNFIILDKEEEVGASWLNRWDSLTLFTPTEFNHLKGLKFPAEDGNYPSKYDVANYFKRYVKHFKLPVKLNTLVEGIEKKENHFSVKHNTGHLTSKNVIVATGPFHVPFTPAFHKALNSSIFQIHSNYYKNPSQLNDGNVLVVGDGDSGYQILDEISSSRDDQVYFSGDTSVKSLPQEILGKTLWWWFTKTGYLHIPKHTWLGKKVSQSRQPVIGTNVKEILSRDNVIPVGYTLNAENTTIFTKKETLKNVKNIVWATGYKPNFKWIKGLELDQDAYPVHDRGVSSMKGLYFVGLPWLHTRASATLGGVKDDANHIAEHIKKHYQKEQAKALA